MKNTFKSIGAILAGFILDFILAGATDAIFVKSGLMTDKLIGTATWVILLVIIYRNVYNVICTYLVATLAPNRPMLHALIVGYIGCALSLLATIVMWSPEIGWYSISITILAIPSAWLGGKLRIMYTEKKNQQP